MGRRFSSYNKIWGSPVNDNRGDKVLSFIEKNELNILIDGRNTRTSGASKSADITISLYSPSSPGMSQTVLYVATSV